MTSREKKGKGNMLKSSLFVSIDNVLKNVVLTRGWYDRCISCPIRSDPDEVFVTATKEYGEEEINFALTLIFSNDYQYFVVNNFEVWTERDEAYCTKRILNPEQFLIFMGREFVDKNLVKTHNKSIKIWTIECPADLVALLKKYDEVAKLYEKIEIFNLDKSKG